MRECIRNALDPLNCSGYIPCVQRGVDTYRLWVYISSTCEAYQLSTCYFCR